MEYLKKLSKPFSILLDILSEIWTDILFKIAGTLFPFYIGAFILMLVDQKSINKIFDPQSFILFSSTFLFSSIFLWHKTPNHKNGIGKIINLFFILLIIAISFLYALSFTAKLDNNFNFDYWSYMLFWITLLIYIYYECFSYYKAKDSTFKKEGKTQYDSFKDSFNKIKEDGE